jgi:hypothetical protein
MVYSFAVKSGIHAGGNLPFRLLLTAIRAVALRRGGKNRHIQTLQLRRLANEAEQGRVTQAVMNVTSGTAVCHNPGFAQGHQVLGEGSLPQAEHGFEMADARLALADGQQDLQAGYLPDGLEQ